MKVFRPDYDVTGRAESDLLMRGSDTVWSEENVYKVFDLTLSGRAGLDIFVSQIFAIVKVQARSLGRKLSRRML